jgi:hypothetical protein
MTLNSVYCGWTNTSIHMDSCYMNEFFSRPCDPHLDIRWCNTTYSPLPIWIQGMIVQQAELPANAFTEPDPSGYSCTVASAGRPVEWRLQEWNLKTEWIEQFYPDRTRTNVYLSLNNSALAPRPDGGLVSVAGGGFDNMTPYLGQNDPSAVFTNWRREFANELYWSLRLDPVLEYMELNQSWYCDDKDPAHP